jgi:hypothetical protein
MRVRRCALRGRDRATARHGERGERTQVGVTGDMTASAGTPPRCFFALLISAGVAGLIVLAIGAPEPQQDGECSTTHAASFAVAFHTRNHVEVGEQKGTQLSDPGSALAAPTPLPYEVLKGVRQAFPAVRHSVVSFFDRVSYYTTGPPLQTA